MKISIRNTQGDFAESVIVKERWVLGAQSENSSEKSYANFPVSPKLKF